MLISLIFVIWFAKRQFQLEKPLLNLHVFAVRQFRLSVLILLCAYFLFMGMEVMMPMYTQQVLLISATTTGLILMPASIAQAIAAPVLGVLLDKKGGRWVLLPATFVLLISLILMWLLFDIQTSTLALSALFALMAMAVSAAITGETHGLNALDKPLHPHGTAVITTLNPIAAALGASIFCRCDEYWRTHWYICHAAGCHIKRRTLEHDRCSCGGNISVLFRFVYSEKCA